MDQTGNTPRLRLGQLIENALGCGEQKYGDGSERLCIFQLDNVEQIRERLELVMQRRLEGMNE